MGRRDPDLKFAYLESAIFVHETITGANDCILEDERRLILTFFSADLTAFLFQRMRDYCIPIGLHQAWLQFYPGFAWTPLGMLIGVVEAFVYGLVAGLVFAPIANFFEIVRGG